MSFADSLTKIVSQKQKEEKARARSANKWTAWESKLLDKACALFKERCVKEAEKLQSTATVSFEALSRETPGFPKRILSDSVFYVDTSGDVISNEVTAEAWFYATRGTATAYTPGTPILFAEMLEGMMPKFLEKIDTLGFSSSGRVSGTWKVTASWEMPGEAQEPPAKRMVGMDRKPRAVGGA
mmetsp:Transcript_101631/g.185459  ORF Transcript_101631/g.185459 Transcript_101631/m.185459 type:complete len:183 (-) Transcript_101631:160-708(-)